MEPTILEIDQGNVRHVTGKTLRPSETEALFDAIFPKFSVSYEAPVPVPGNGESAESLSQAIKDADRAMAKARALVSKVAKVATEEWYDLGEGPDFLISVNGRDVSCGILPIRDKVIRVMLDDTVIQIDDGKIRHIGGKDLEFSEIEAAIDAIMPELDVEYVTLDAGTDSPGNPVFQGIENDLRQGTESVKPRNDSIEAARIAHDAAKPYLDRAYASLKSVDPLELSTEDLKRFNRLKDEHRDLAFEVGMLEERLDTEGDEHGILDTGHGILPKDSFENPPPSKKLRIVKDGNMAADLKNGTISYDLIGLCDPEASEENGNLAFAALLVLMMRDGAMHYDEIVDELARDNEFEDQEEERKYRARAISTVARLVDAKAFSKKGMMITSNIDWTPKGA